jgi:hypothetical protein
MSRGAAPSEEVPYRQHWESTVSLTTPLEGLRACSGSYGNVGPDAKPAVPCAVCGRPIADPPPEPRFPCQPPLVETCSFRCALRVFERDLDTLSRRVAAVG